LDGKLNIQNISRFGRDFSIVRIPYAFKLLLQELQTMNIQLRIITEDNIDQLTNMSYSNNIDKLLKTGDRTDLSMLYNNYKRQIYQQTQEKMSRNFKPVSSSSTSTVPYADGSPAYSPPYNPNDSPAYDPNASPAYNPFSTPDHSSEDIPPNYEPHSPDEPPPISSIKVENEEVRKDFNSLPERDKVMLMKMVAEQKAKKNKDIEEKQVETPKPQLGGTGVLTPTSEEVTSILKVEDESPENLEGESNVENTNSGSGSGSGSETKSISFDTGMESSGTSGETKQIRL
jgi:DNA-directed RNA polymerase II subunit RPB2